MENNAFWGQNHIENNSKIGLVKENRAENVIEERMPWDYYEYECLNCNKVFIPHKVKNANFCSIECEKIALDGAECVE